MSAYRSVAQKLVDTADIVRDPQDGKPLNYFVYPYVEVDGKEYPNVSLAFSFEDVGSGL